MYDKFLISVGHLQGLILSLILTRISKSRPKEILKIRRLGWIKTRRREVSILFKEYPFYSAAIPFIYIPILI
jgi:hypothetical protein